MTPFLKSNLLSQFWRALLTANLGFLVLSCAHNPEVTHSPATYPSDDSLGKGDVAYVPPEFRNGTATLDQAKAWARALFTGMAGRGEIETEECDLTPAGRRAWFISDRSLEGVVGGNNSYMVFDQTPKGLRYLGEVSGYARPVPSDVSGNPRLVTYWHLGADDGTLTLWSLTSTGFESTKVLRIHPSDNSGTEESKRIYDGFFGPAPVTEELVEATFGPQAIFQGAPTPPGGIKWADLGRFSPIWSGEEVF